MSPPVQRAEQITPKCELCHALRRWYAARTGQRAVPTSPNYGETIGWVFRLPGGMGRANRRSQSKRRQAWHFLFIISRRSVPFVAFCSSAIPRREASASLRQGHTLDCAGRAQRRRRFRMAQRDQGNRTPKKAVSRFACHRTPNAGTRFGSRTDMKRSVWTAVTSALLSMLRNG
jgi:hypothetical protein